MPHNNQPPAVVLINLPRWYFTDPRPTEVRTSDAEYLQERQRLLHTQRCGGGRRIVRKRIGGD